MNIDYCICCGRLVAFAAARMNGGPAHFDCWERHHSDPTGPWPPDHVCADRMARAER